MNSKYYKSIVFLRRFALLKRKTVLPFKLLSSGFLRSESYYPELQRKSRFRIFCDLLAHILKFGSIEWHYFSYGLDIKNFREPSDFMDDSEFLWKASMLNTVLPERDNSCLLRDKYLFSIFLSHWGFRSPKVLGVIGKESGGLVLENIIGEPGDYFLKPIDGQCGGGIFKLTISDNGTLIRDGQEVSRDSVMQLILSSNRKYIVQSRVPQHSQISALYDRSINTIRLITVYDKGRDMVSPLSAVLRVGAHGNVVDNWAAGGLAIGIDIKTGRLKGDGFFKHGKGTKTSAHPDSGVIFDGYQLPFFYEAITDAVRLHRHLLPLMVIGWDIAITPEGPLFIEGNDNMEISINQEVNGGLRKTFETIISSFHRF